jgi:hypothetical protein
MNRAQKIVPMAAVLALPLLLTGCGMDQARNPFAPAMQNVMGASARAAQPDGMAGAKRGAAHVLFVHASPDAPAVDIYVGRRPMARGLEFPGNTLYEGIRAGAGDVRVNVAGTTTTVISATVPFQARTWYSIFAVNTVANIEPLLLTDDLTPPAAGKAHVRFVHLSPNAPAVDVAVADGGPVVFGNKSFKDYTPFTPLPAGTYELEVRLAGTSTVVLPLPGIKLEAGKIYTVFAKGLAGGTGPQALGAQVIVNSDLLGDEMAGRDNDMDEGAANRDDR